MTMEIGSIRAYGAVTIAVLCGPGLGGSRLDSTYFPSWENLLKNIVKVGSNMDDMACESRYKFLCKGTTKACSETKTKRTSLLNASRHDEWA